VTTPADAGAAAPRVLSHTTSLCPECRRSVAATVERSGAAVVMRKSCPEHGLSQVRLASDGDWYERMLALAPRLRRPEGAHAVSHGCPFDCGPCQAHEQSIELPIVTITSACNLDCPICYTHNKNDGAYHMSEAELGALLGHLRRAAPERRIINLTGGEPTLHPDFVRIVELCRAEGIHRVTISTHGLRFLKDEWLLAELARLRARVVLSFDSLEAEPNRRMLGGDLLAAKLKVLALLERYAVDTTLLPVLARGQNDREVGRLVDLALGKAFIRSIELHPMTFTGQGGAGFDRAGRYTTDEVLADLQAQTGGRLRVDDFVPSPAAHPLCYLVTYLLALPDGRRWLPFPRFMATEDLRELLDGGLYLEPTARVEATLADITTRLWAGDLPCEDPPAVLGALRAFVDDVFAPELAAGERLRRAEARTKAIYVHAHMDEETFDTDRIRQCPVGIREPDGRNIPSCAYNVLYRARDGRFREAPEAPLVTLGRGRTSPPADERPPG
jgi:uncharacterized radical SAM superfamily Fe-S cluster-containing enzyme